MALSAPSTVLSWLSSQIQNTDMMPVDASANTGGGLIYAGGFIGLNGATGYIRRWQASDSFVGVAARSGSNVATATPLDRYAGGAIGSGSAGGLKVPVITHGYILWRGSITGLAATVAAADTVVYCSADDTITTTGGGANAKIGVVRRYDTDLGAFVIEIVGKIDKDAVS
jgi:hypothetical protein